MTNEALRRWKNELASIKEELHETIDRKNEAEVMVDSSMGIDPDKTRWKNELTSIKEGIEELNLRQQEAEEAVLFASI